MELKFCFSVRHVVLVSQIKTNTVCTLIFGLFPPGVIAVLFGTDQSVLCP